MPATLITLTPRVFLMPPAPPDRPALLAVAGTRETLLLDAGASAEHAQAMLDALDAHGITRPRMVAFTHWHWDHVFGAAHLRRATGAMFIGHTGTAAALDVLAGYAWDDAALDARVAAGTEFADCARNIKLELPAPRTVEIASIDLRITRELLLNPGGIECLLLHVGGDHAADSVIAWLPGERILFLGDCLYDAIYTPMRHYTTARLFPLLERLERFPAEHIIEGHNDAVHTPASFARLIAQMRAAGTWADAHAANAERVLAGGAAGLSAAVAEAVAAGHIDAALTITDDGQPDDELIEIAEAFLAGHVLAARAAEAVHIAERSR